MRVHTALPVVALALALASCSAPAAVVEPSVGATTAPSQAAPAAMTHDRISAVLRDYDIRNNAAIELSDKALDPSGWAAADSGPVLRIDEFATAYAQAVGPYLYPQMLTTAPRQFYAPAFDGYPRWFMTEATMAPRGASDYQRGQQLLVFAQHTAQDPWRLDAAMDFPVMTIEPLEAGAPSTASEPQRAAAQQAAAGIQAFVSTGVPTTIQPDQTLKDFQSPPVDPTAPSLVAEPPTIALLGDAGDAIRVVAVHGGALALLTFEFHRQFHAADPGGTISFEDPVLGKVLNQEGQRSLLSGSGVLFVAVLLPDDGPPSVLRADASRTL